MRLAQSFAIDLALGLSLLLVIGIPLGAFLLGQSNPTDMQSEADLLSSSLLNPHPIVWNSSNVIIPGFATDHKVNHTQLDQVIALCPGELEDLLGLSGNAVFNLSVNGSEVASCGESSQDADYIGVARRYVALNASIAELEVLVWR